MQLVLGFSDFFTVKLEKNTLRMRQVNSELLRMRDYLKINRKSCA
jgi:LytS/YehU family sensor histidine kinase